MGCWAFVAERLIESLDAAPGAELSPEWREEIRKRCRELDKGLVELRDAADVFEKAYASLRKNQSVRRYAPSEAAPVNRYVFSLAPPAIEHFHSAPPSSLHYRCTLIVARCSSARRSVITESPPTVDVWGIA